MAFISPYEQYAPAQWQQITERLVGNFPLSGDEIVSAVFTAWDMIRGTRIGPKLIVGANYFPTPQILGEFLHELVPLILEENNSDWRKCTSKAEKDVVYLPDDFYSFEIKTSSQSKIYGNRSFSQKGERKSAKSKSGFYLAINYPPLHTKKLWLPIAKIRFGWLDETDWMGQAAATGQQASLSSDVFKGKLLTLYSA